MRALIDTATKDLESYVPGVIAEQVVAYLRVSDPVLLHGWLDQQAVTLVRNMINARDRSARTYARTHSSQSVFAKYASRVEAGEAEAMVDWLNTVHQANAENLRKKLADMNGQELSFAASKYEQRELDNRFMKVFLRALAKKVGDSRVEDIYTNAQLREMYNSLME